MNRFGRFGIAAVVAILGVVILAPSGASAAGMLIFGPVGAIGGIFVHGKEAVIPAGAVFYTQVRDDISLNGLVRKNQTADSLDKFIEQNM